MAEIMLTTTRQLHGGGMKNLGHTLAMRLQAHVRQMREGAAKISQIS
jgi:hypothetical protein